MWLRVLGFMVMGLVSGLSLANHSDRVLPGAHALLSQDGGQQRFWEVEGHVASPFDLSRTLLLQSVQFSSVTQSCPTLCDPMNHSTPGLPVHHQLPEFTQTHVY